jgi:hypothetical protein
VFWDKKIFPLCNKYGILIWKDFAGLGSMGLHLLVKIKKGKRFSLPSPVDPYGFEP